MVFFLTYSKIPILDDEYTGLFSPSARVKFGFHFGWASRPLKLQILELEYTFFPDVQQS